MSLDAPTMIAMMKRELDPLFRGLLFRVERGQQLADDDSIMIVFAQVPAGSPEIDALNSRVSLMLHIKDTRSYGAPLWKRGAPAPAQVKVEQFRGRGIRMRATTGSAAHVVKYVVAWFKKHQAELRG